MRDALVVGYGHCVWSDLHAARALTEHPVVFAVNKAILLPLTIDHAVSHHAEAVGPLLACRRSFRSLRAFGRPEILTHSIKTAPGVNHLWDLPRQGDSGLLAIRIALAMGHARVLVAGCPLAGGHLDDDPEAPAIDWTMARGVWDAAADEFGDRVLSLSGWTRERLSRPPAEVTSCR